MDVPAFSIFSAISEVFVTIVVLYVVLGNLRGKTFRWKLLGLFLIFELCVNVVYMVIRAGADDAASDLGTAMVALSAAHGILSLVMFIGLMLLYLVSTFDHKAGQPTWFQRHTQGTWGFLALWLISVVSGEVLFIWRYALPS